MPTTWACTSAALPQPPARRRRSLAVSRRLANPDGSFAGVVVGTLRLAYFRDRFAGLSIGERDVITVFRNDGAVLARDPYSMSDLGDDLAMSPAFQQFLIRREGAFVGMLSPDGVRRLYTFDSVEGTPVVVAVALAVDEVLQPWVRRAMLIVPVTIALSAAMLALMLLYRREMARRGEVERKLEAQAHTDGLTGISNRRLFDEVLEREWQSALRERAPLSLLFVDADHFKRYNDRYGHQEGDALLRRLAQPSARRPAAARPGGALWREEFVLLLPRTEGRQALAIAERLRKSVAALRLRTRTMAGHRHAEHRGGVGAAEPGRRPAWSKPRTRRSIAPRRPAATACHGRTVRAAGARRPQGGALQAGLSGPASRPAGGYAPAARCEPGCSGLAASCSIPSERPDR